MKSDYDKIKQDLYNLYPNTKSELIDDLIKIYFDKTKEAIANFKKPSIALLWGTATIKVRKLEEEVRMLEAILRNRDNPEINKYNEEQLKRKEIKLEKIKTVLKAHKDTVSEGKTMRHKKRKHETKSD